MNRFFLKNIFPVTLFLFILFTTIACHPINYIENAPYTPMFEEKHSYRVSAKISNKNVDVNLAASPIKYVGIVASYSNLLSFVANPKLGQYSFEIAPLFWHPITNKSSKGNQLFFDFQLGYGQGCTDSDEITFLGISSPSNHAYGKSNWKKIFLQPSFYLILPRDPSSVNILNIGAKLSFTNFDDLSYSTKEWPNNNYPNYRNYVSTGNKSGQILSVFFSHTIKKESFQVSGQIIYVAMCNYPDMGAILYTTDKDRIGKYVTTASDYNLNQNKLLNQFDTHPMVSFDRLTFNISYSFLIESIWKKRIPEEN